MFIIRRCLILTLWGKFCLVHFTEGPVADQGFKQMCQTHTQTVLTTPPRLAARILNVKPPSLQNYHFYHRFPGETLLNYLTGIFNIFSFSTSKSPPITVIRSIPPFSDFHCHGCKLGQLWVSRWKAPSLLAWDPEGLHLQLSSATWLSHPPGQGLPWLLPLELLSDPREWEVRTEGFPASHAACVVG